MGPISNHGILIVEIANEMQEAGKSRREAILEAAAIRLCPILMTTAAMVLGVVLAAYVILAADQSKKRADEALAGAPAAGD